MEKNFIFDSNCSKLDLKFLVKQWIYVKKNHIFSLMRGGGGVVQWILFFYKKKVDLDLLLYECLVIFENHREICDNIWNPFLLSRKDLRLSPNIYAHTLLNILFLKLTCKSILSYYILYHLMRSNTIKEISFHCVFFFIFIHRHELTCSLVGSDKDSYLQM